MKEKKSNLLKNIYADSRKKAAFKLGFWFSFILFVIFLVIFTSSKNELDNSKENLTYEAKINNLLSSDYEYIYTINQNGETIIFNGNKFNTIETGFKEIKEKIIKYRIEDDKSYQIILNEKIEYDIYENLNADFLNIKKIFDNLNDVSYVKNDNSYIYSFRGDKYEIFSNELSIEKIMINEDEYVLELKVDV